MTIFLLIRHASHDLLGNTLAGRTRDVGLNDQGHREAQALATRLADIGLAALYVSPRRRAHETVAPLARRLGRTPTDLDAIDEVDFGAWSGRAFADLTSDAQWSVWCTQRSAAQPPAGETIGAVQQRVVAAMKSLRDTHPDQTTALVSHGDVVKVAIAHFLDLSLDHLERFDIAPASVSVVVMGRDWAQVRLVNWTGGLVVG